MYSCTRSRRRVLQHRTVWVFVVLAWLAGGSLARGEGGEMVAIRCGRLIDGTGAAPVEDAVIVVEGERIVAIGSEVPEGAQVIDLGDATVLPGLIDAHLHPLIAADDYQTVHLQRSSAYKALWGLKGLQGVLRAGWTSVRIAGDADVHYAPLDVKRAIDEGLFVGPRIAGAGHYISITGGGGDINYIAPEQRVIADGLVVDGVDEMRKAVREEVKYGSDWIKLLVTGAFMSAGDNPRDVHLSPEELATAVEEADRLGVPVMAHAHATEGIKQAIRAGVRSIEHGTFIDDEAIRLMLERGTFLVPTLYIGDYYIEKGSETGAQDKMIELSLKYREDYFRRARAAVEAGVKIAVGSDFGGHGYPPEINVRELGSLVEAGMTPMQAIEAATRVGAELLGWDDRLGTVESGKLADLIAVQGDPLANLSVLESVEFVMLGGQVVADVASER